MNSPRALFLSLTAMTVAIFSCAPLQTAGGSSSTDNGKILGMIRLENGLPAPHVQVTLLPAYSDPYRDGFKMLTDTTDTAGGYAFDSLAPGNYTVEAVSIGDRTRAIVYGIPVDSTTTYAPAASVARPGALSIKVPADTSTAMRYVYLPGTSFYAVVQDRFGFIDSVAPGIIPSVHYVNLAAPAESRVMVTNVRLASGATALVADHSSWNYSKKLFLNTTSSGAAVSADVYRFPVLVRLTAANFDFGQAGPDGSDLRFRKSDDSPLPYEIERWDPVAGLAEVWVKVDTVHGNDSAQFITLLCGSPDTATESNGAAVFDTADGFQGLWHLGDAGDSVKDATANRFNGGSPDTARPIIAEGVIGECRRFDGIRDFITMPGTRKGKLDFPQNSHYTVSAWVHLDTLDNLSRLIVSKGFQQYYLRTTNFSSASELWEFVEFKESTLWNTSTEPATSGRWMLITGVMQGDRQFLFCNGDLVDSTANVWAMAKGMGFTRMPKDLSIGGFLEPVTFPQNDGYCFFKGSIDEVRICSAALGVDWIRLCYMNQRRDDRLVVHGK
jgi:hypothetical protein